MSESDLYDLQDLYTKVTRYEMDDRTITERLLERVRAEYIYLYMELNFPFVESIRNRDAKLLFRDIIVQQYDVFRTFSTHIEKIGRLQSHTDLVTYVHESEEFKNCLQSILGADFHIEKYIQNAYNTIYQNILWVPSMSSIFLQTDVPFSADVRREYPESTISYQKFLVYLELFREWQTLTFGHVQSFASDARGCINTLNYHVARIELFDNIIHILSTQQVTADKEHISTGHLG